jgi:hypothetical protein
VFFPESSQRLAPHRTAPHHTIRRRTVPCHTTTKRGKLLPVATADGCCCCCCWKGKEAAAVAAPTTIHHTLLLSVEETETYFRLEIRHRLYLRTAQRHNFGVVLLLLLFVPDAVCCNDSDVAATLLQRIRLMLFLLACIYDIIASHSSALFCFDCLQPKPCVTVTDVDGCVGYHTTYLPL